MFKSCKEILNHDRTSLSGLYWIKTPTGPLQVYCEMVVDGGGYTFLPRSAIRENSFGGVQISTLFTQKDRVLLRHQMKDGSQPYTLIKQLPQYANISLAVMKNSYAGHSSPGNFPHLRPFLYLGVLPSNLARVSDAIHYVFSLLLSFFDVIVICNSGPF